MMKTSLLPLFAVALLSFALASTVDAQRPGVRRALLIGINRYASDDWKDLRGCVNDVKRIARVLETRLGFARENITFLLNEKATRRAILSAIRKIKTASRGDDFLYIHYAGHGSQQRDFDEKGDESDGLDETLVPHDARTGDVTDIVDDELDEILGQGTHRNGIIVLDSCHSGTAVRGGLRFAVRSVPRDTDPARLRAYAAISSRAVRKVKDSYLVMTGADARQAALDGICDGTRHGFFSYAIARTLESAPRGITLGAAWRRIRQHLVRLKVAWHLGDRMPEPQLEVAASRRRFDEPLFSFARREADATETRRVWLVVRGRLDQNFDRVALADGAALGAAVGSAWRLYPAGETAFTGAPIATIKIVAHRGSDAIGTIQREGRVRQSMTDARAVLAAHPATAPRMTIRFGDRAMRIRGLVDRVKKSLEDVQVVTDGSARYEVQADDQRIRVIGPAGNAVASVAAGETAADEVADALFRSAAARQLAALENPDADLSIDVRMLGGVRTSSRGLADDETGLRRTRYRARRTRGGEKETQTDENSAAVRIACDEPCYVTVVDVDPEGRVNVLFPGARDLAEFPDGRIEGGEVTLPRNRRWSAYPPFGTDTLRVFATRNPATADAIRRLAREASAVTDPNRPRGIDRGLAPLRRLSRHLLWRGLADDAVDADDERDEGATPAPGDAAPSVDAAIPPGPDWASVAIEFDIIEGAETPQR